MTCKIRLPLLLALAMAEVPLAANSNAPTDTGVVTALPRGETTGVSVAVEAPGKPVEKIYASSEALDAKLSEVQCKIINETGTRLGRKRLCKTRAEWTADAENTRAELRRQDESRAASSRSD